MTGRYSYLRVDNRNHSNPFIPKRIVQTIILMISKFHFIKYLLRLRRELNTFSRLLNKIFKSNHRCHSAASAIIRKNIQRPPNRYRTFSNNFVPFSNARNFLLIYEQRFDCQSASLLSSLSVNLTILWAFVFFPIDTISIYQIVKNTAAATVLLLCCVTDRNDSTFLSYTICRKQKGEPSHSESLFLIQCIVCDRQIQHRAG